MSSLVIVFILAVVLSLILFAAFVSYFMGWWGVWTGYMRAPRFHVSIGAVGENLVLRVYVVNEGNVAVKVLGVVVDGGAYRFVNDSVWVVKPRESKWVTISRWRVVHKKCDPIPGDVVRVCIYTE